MALEVIRESLGAAYGSAELKADLEHARSQSTSMDDRLGYLSGTLNEQAKEQLLGAAAHIMTADGSIDSRDRDAVKSIGEKLTMSPAHVRGVIDTAEESISA